MTSSSLSSSSYASIVGLIPSRPLVFITSHEEDISKGLISFLEPVLENENINVFIDEDEVRGRDLTNLFQRLKDSRISLAIFSESKCGSYEPPKIKGLINEECPMFYKVDSVYGNRHLANLQNCERSTKKAINSAVDQLNTLLANISIGVNKENETDSNCFVVPARKLQISHSENQKNWTWNSIYETTNETAMEIAMLNEVYWLHISGNYHTRNLTPGTKYKVVFLVRLEDTSAGWEQPVKLRLKLVNPDGTESLQERATSLECHIGENWVDIQAGVLVAPARNEAAKMMFTMYQYVTSDRKSGLLVKGVAIRPMY